MAEYLSEQKTFRREAVNKIETHNEFAFSVSLNNFQDNQREGANNLELLHCMQFLTYLLRYDVRMEVLRHSSGLGDKPKLYVFVFNNSNRIEGEGEIRGT
jgi:hypothetical protein